MLREFSVVMHHFKMIITKTHEGRNFIFMISFNFVECELCMTEQKRMINYALIQSNVVM